MDKISAVYQIVNTVTGDSYVGSSVDVKQRWTSHKCPSRWRRCPNNPMYLDFQKFGLDKFRFQILAPVEPENLKQVEQEFIEKLKPAYNSIRAKGQNIERWKETKREYRQSDRYKDYQQSERRKESVRKYQKKYDSQLCSYNGETVKLAALSARFRKAGIEHPTVEARKYLIEEVN